MSIKDKLRQLTAGVDLWLKKVIGEENVILYHFAQYALIAIILVLLVSAVVWIVALLFQAVSFVVAAIVMALPYLLALAVIAGVVALSIYALRIKTSKRRREVQRHSGVEGQNAPYKQAAADPADEGAAVRRSLLAADQRTRRSLESVLASLQRFDHRLELVITPAHYADLFGDNWVNVRVFAESSLGRNVPEVSTKLVEIIILYKRAQEARWVPVNHERIQAWWSEASRRRKWLVDAVESTASDAGLAEVRTQPEAGPIPEIGVASTSPETREGAAPELSVSPTLDQLLRYYEWVDHRSRQPRR